MTWSDRAVASLAAGGGLGVENAPFLVVGETGADVGFGRDSAQLNALFPPRGAADRLGEVSQSV